MVLGVLSPGIGQGHGQGIQGFGLPTSLMLQPGPCAPSLRPIPGDASGFVQNTLGFDKFPLTCPAFCEGGKGSSLLPGGPGFL
jgi:hypothetical protein